MVANRLRVRWPDADVDERDPGPPFGHQVIGRHLVPPPLSGGDLRFGVGQLARLEGRPRHRQRRKARILAP